ncbi:MAG: type III PLP-dependent enzyme [Myxococcota bacterium]|jgi:ornithine decarboxylase|nr:type III PLP-dependent enzyme [Myxococcota bacterium]
MVEALHPEVPVVCVRSHAMERAARVFTEQFPGDSLYAVKCNPSAHVLATLSAAGIRHFDTASMTEIEWVSSQVPDATCYFMHPVKSRAAIREAYSRYAVRYFALDHRAELDKIAEELPASRDVVLVVRVAVLHSAVVYDLSGKFGASPEEAHEIMEEAYRRGFSVGLCFHVGSQCTDAQAYISGIERVVAARAGSATPLRCLDVGGGFPGHYLESPVEELDHYLSTIAGRVEELDLDPDCRLLCEPGRGLCEAGESLVVQVQLKKERSIYLNDGIYGSMTEEGTGLRHRHRMVATRPFSQTRAPFTAYGPTCDSVDVLPHPLVLPDDVREGDWLEFGNMGAYGVACSTAFNGFSQETFVALENAFVADDPPLA